MKKKKILFLTSSLEEKTRGIGIILKNLIYSAKEEGHECGILMGFCSPLLKKQTIFTNSMIDQLLMRSYLKNGRELFKFTYPTSLLKMSILKKIMTLQIFASREIKIQNDLDLKKQAMLNYIDFVIQSPFIYQFLDHNYKWLSRKILQRLVLKYKIDLVVAASPTILRSCDLRPAKLAQFVHDIIPLEIKETGVKNAFKKRFKETIDIATNQSDFLMTNSYDTANKICDAKKKNNLHVLYGSSLNQKIVPRELRHVLTYYHLNEKSYLLFVSAVEERKNVINLLSAYAMVANQINMPLVIVGQPGCGSEAILSHYETLPSEIKKKIIFTGHIAEEEKVALYQYAYAFIFPSFYEGLGLGVIEAMEYHLPVITSRNGGLIEVGGEAALYIDDPYNAAEIAEKISQLCNDPALRETMVEKGKQWVENFSFDKFKERFANIIAQV